MTLNRKDLHESDRELIENVLSKPKEHLTHVDIDILNARRDYLTLAERLALGNLLRDNDNLPPADTQPAEQQETIWTDPQNQNENQTQEQAASQEEPVNPESSTEETATPPAETAQVADQNQIETQQTEQTTQETQTTDNPYAPDESQQLA